MVEVGGGGSTNLTYGVITNKPRRDETAEDVRGVYSQTCLSVG